MKLCNYRYPKNAQGGCRLSCFDVNQTERGTRRLSEYVFQPDGRGRAFSDGGAICDEKLSQVCPYRVHIPIPSLPRTTPLREKCPLCNRRHKTELGESFCYAYDKFKKEMQPWKSEGSRSEIWPDSKYARRYHANIWPSLTYQIFQRDKWKCQDCGLGTDTSQYSMMGRSYSATVEGLPIPFEVHHILPRGMGGSDHPANLKLVCQNCHKKYNEKFNGQIISQKAQERKTAQIQKSHKPLESYEVSQ